MLQNRELSMTGNSSNNRVTVRKRASRKKKNTIGWREMVSLPDLDIAGMKAKIDTGARTSALHAEQQELFTRQGVPWVQFLVPSGNGGLSSVKAPLFDRREIKNTSGVPEERLVIRTRLLLGGHCWTIDVSLADRKQMEFDLILGRTAIRGKRVLVDPGRSFVAGQPGVDGLSDAGITGQSVS